jgi:hypothetical protein
VGLLTACSVSIEFIKPTTSAANGRRCRQGL